MNTRRLVAIMFTDIQGYTAMMQENEENALRMRNKHRDVFQQVTQKYQGEILRYYGDGTLSVFESAVAAVQCGIEIQKALLSNPHVPCRIGIHSGDIIFAEDDIIGDGVNLASRIESLSVVGSVFISDKVHDEIKNNPSIKTQFLKAFRLKNVNHPVGVYAVTNEGLVVPSLNEISGKLESDSTGKIALKKQFLIPAFLLVALLVIAGIWTGIHWKDITGFDKKRTVVVYPLEGDEVDEEQRQIESGMTSELIEELSKIDRLHVIDKSSTQVLAAGLQPLNSLVTAERHDVDYFVDGRIDREGNRLSLFLELKDKGDDQASWQKSYSEDIARARFLWADAAKDLAGEMNIQIDPANSQLWNNIRAINPETYEYYLKGVHFMNQSTEADWQKGLVFLEQALDRNPADPYAYAWLAEGYIRLGHGPNPPPEVFPKALAAAERAIQLDSTNAHGWAALSHYHTYFGWDWEVAEAAFHRANELNPNLAYNHYHRAWYLALFGRMNEAIEEHIKAQELDPFTPLHTAWLGELYRLVGEYDKAMAEVDKTLEMKDQYALGLLVKGKILVDLERYEEAIEAHRQAAAINPGWRYLGLALTLIEAGQIKEALKIKAEMEAMPPTPFGSMCLAAIYAFSGDVENYFKWKTYPLKEKHAWYPWMRINMQIEKIKNDPRFLELIRDMGLPDPAPLQYDPGKST